MDGCLSTLSFFLHSNPVSQSSKKLVHIRSVVVEARIGISTIWFRPCKQCRNMNLSFVTFHMIVRSLQIFWHQLDILTDILQKRLDVFVLQCNAKLNWKIPHCTYMDMDIWGGLHVVIALCYLEFFEKAEKKIKHIWKKVIIDEINGKFWSSLVEWVSIHFSTICVMLFRSFFS